MQDERISIGVSEQCNNQHARIIGVIKDVRCTETNCCKHQQRKPTNVLSDTIVACMLW